MKKNKIKSLKVGRNILSSNSLSEITAITHLGFFILVSGKEFFVPFSEYPVFKNASIKDIYNFKLLSPRQIYWENLDCDIELDAIENPENFPLEYKY